MVNEHIFILVLEKYILETEQCFYSAYKNNQWENVNSTEKILEILYKIKIKIYENTQGTADLYCAGGLYS